MRDTFGPYRVQEVVARGSTGTVYRTRHAELDREAAVKVLSDEVRDVPGQVDRLRAEASILASMSHPHIVEVYDYVEDEAGAWIAEQWIDGGPIQTILDTHGTLDPQQALGVVRGAILGLAHAHARDIVHRDISTTNIMADMDGTSMLVDFGIAAPAGSGHALGTPAFISPEAAAGLPVTKASDVYSVAAVLHLLLTGSPVFGGTVTQTIEGHLHGTPPALTGHGSQLADLMRRSLSKAPGERPADAAAFLAELESAAAARYGSEWLAGSSIAGLTGVFGPGRSVLTIIGNAVGIGTGSAISVTSIAAAITAAVVLVAGIVGAVALTDDGDSSSPSASSTPSPDASSAAPGTTGPDGPGTPTDPDGASPDADPLLRLLLPRTTDTPSSIDLLGPSDPVDGRVSGDDAGTGGGDGPGAYPGEGPGGGDPGTDPEPTPTPTPTPTPEPTSTPEPTPTPTPDPTTTPDPPVDPVALNEARLNGTWRYEDTVTETTYPDNLGASFSLQTVVTATCSSTTTCTGTRNEPGSPTVSWFIGTLGLGQARSTFNRPPYPGCVVTGGSSSVTVLRMDPAIGGSATVVGTTYIGTWRFTYTPQFSAPCPSYDGPVLETHTVTFTKLP